MVYLHYNAVDFVKNCDMMCQQSVWSSVLAAQLAAKHLKDGGVLTLTGAQPALNGTAGIVKVIFLIVTVKHFGEPPNYLALLSYCQLCQQRWHLNIYM